MMWKKLEVERKGGKMATKKSELRGYIGGISGGELQMKKNHCRAIAVLVVGVVWAFISLQAAWAANFPEPAEVYVNDYAGVLSPADAQSIRELSRNAREQTGLEIAVVTLDSLSAYADPGQTLESFATALFDHWGIGRKNANDGILILFVLNDRKVRIELGAAFGSQYDAAMREVVDGRMIPYFKNGDYSRGLYEGTRAVLETVTKKVSWFKYHMVDLILAGLAVVCVLAGISCMRSGKKGWGWAFFSIAGMLIVSVILRALFRGKRGGGGFGGGRSGGGGASGSW